MKIVKNAVCAVAAIVLFALTTYAAETKQAAKPAPTTLENLQAAYDGESNAKAKYEAYAAKADAEGYAGVAALFRANAMSESIHAAKHAKVIAELGAAPMASVKASEIKSTRENLKNAIAGEEHESQHMYPAFLKKAEADKNAHAVMSFKGALATEKGHAKLYSEALKNLSSWKAKKKFLVCQTCGYTTPDMNIKTCPVCSQPRSQFSMVE